MYLMIAAVSVCMLILPLHIPMTAVCFNFASYNYDGCCVMCVLILPPNVPMLSDVCVDSFSSCTYQY